MAKSETRSKPKPTEAEIAVAKQVKKGFSLEPGVPVPGPEGDIRENPHLRPYAPKYEDLRVGDGFQNNYIRWIIYRKEDDYCIMGAENCRGHRFSRESMEGTCRYRPFVPRPEDWESRYGSQISTAGGGATIITAQPKRELTPESIPHQRKVSVKLTKAKEEHQDAIGVTLEESVEKSKKGLRKKAGQA